MVKADRNKIDLYDIINNQLKKGKVRDYYRFFILREN